MGGHSWENSCDPKISLNCYEERSNYHLDNNLIREFLILIHELLTKSDT